MSTFDLLFDTMALKHLGHFRYTSIDERTYRRQKIPDALNQYLLKPGTAPGGNFWFLPVGYRTCDSIIDVTKDPKRYLIHLPLIGKEGVRTRDCIALFGFFIDDLDPSFCRFGAIRAEERLSKQIHGITSLAASDCKLKYLLHTAVDLQSTQTEGRSIGIHFGDTVQTFQGNDRGSNRLTDSIFGKVFDGTRIRLEKILVNNGDERSFPSLLACDKNPFSDFSRLALCQYVQTIFNLNYRVDIIPFFVGAISPKEIALQLRGIEHAGLQDWLALYCIEFLVNDNEAVRKMSKIQVEGDLK